jgi:hypothetical protein
LHPMDMVPAHRTRAAMAVNEAERLEIFIGLAYQDCLERIRTIDSVGYLHNQ